MAIEQTRAGYQRTIGLSVTLIAPCDGTGCADPIRYEATTGFGILSPDAGVSASHALIKVWIVSSNGDDDELAAAYRNGRGRLSAIVWTDRDGLSRRR